MGMVSFAEGPGTSKVFLLILALGARLIRDQRPIKGNKGKEERRKKVVKS
jgi:hypothetical protein